MSGDAASKNCVDVLTIGTMDRTFVIPDEWLEDIRTLAGREADGHNVMFSRKALHGLLARLDEAERRGRALEWIEPLLGEIRAVLTQAVNQLPLSDGPLLEQFGRIHDRMRHALAELNKLNPEAR